MGHPLEARLGARPTGSLMVLTTGNARASPRHYWRGWSRAYAYAQTVLHFKPLPLPSRFHVARPKKTPNPVPSAPMLL